ncbi:hypothetical protein FQA39_LY00071 [Lamprigera yunnana]|nr:hypothetical protein FQA39_LY00071 [Lamprigera yunnana]
MVRLSKRKKGSKGSVTNKELKDIEDLTLPFSKLKFCGEQLQNLNYIFTKKLTEEPDPEYANAIILAKSVTERLMQRLLCAAGMQDSRFATKFLITLHEDNNIGDATLGYIIRLDSLSTPALYIQDEIPKYSIVEGGEDKKLAGYAKIRLHPSCSKGWEEFINSKGYLRRDKIQSKMVELIAKAATCDVPNSSLDVDESRFCGSPGKVVNAATLQKILLIPTEEHVFYGAVGNTPRFPDPRDFKLAIVDDPTGVRIRVGFHSPALSRISIEVSLLIAISFDAWPSSTNFPFRISLGHSDCILYYKAAQTGLYLTAYGVYSSDWQIRLPAAEFILDKNYSDTSTVNAVLQTLYPIVKRIYDDYKQHQVSYKILTSYTVRTALWYHLEDDGSSPTDLILNWSQRYLSTHVLIVLDNVIGALKRQYQPNYFFPKANVLTNPGHLCEDDFILESSKIRSMMLRFFDDSLVCLMGDTCFTSFTSCQKSEVMLLNKWKDLMIGLVPPVSTRGSRLCCSVSKEIVHDQYTTRQLEYIGLAIKNMLLVRQNVLLEDDEISWIENIKFLHLKEDHVEDMVHIFTTLMDQARDQYLDNLPECASGNVDQKKLKKDFNVAATKLLDLIRKEKEITDILDDITTVKIILKWFYKGLDYNKRSLGPILRPYLKTIFVTSHEASWHLEAIKSDDVQNEVKALGVFAKLVNSGKITPAQGLVNSVKKNWNWAKNMLADVEMENIRLIFIPFKDKTIKHVLVAPSNINKNSSLENLKMNQYDLNFTTKHYSNSLIVKCKIMFFFANSL